MQDKKFDLNEFEKEWSLLGKEICQGIYVDTECQKLKQALQKKGYLTLEEKSHFIRGGAGDALGRRPWDLSFRDVIEPELGRSLRRRRTASDSHRRGSGRGEGLHDPGRLGPFPDRDARPLGRPPAGERA